MRTEDWGKVYKGLVQMLPAYVREARLTICGLSTFLDGYVRLHEAESLLNAKGGTPQAALSRELFRRAASVSAGNFTWIGQRAESGLKRTCSSRVGDLAEAERKLPKCWLSLALRP